MKQSALNKAVAWLLVLYFMAFIIPPVSSLIETGLARSTAENSLSKEPCRQHTQLFLIDLFLWEQITETKRSGNHIVKHGPQDQERGPATHTAYCDTVANGVPANSLWAGHSVRQATPGRSHLALIRYARSDIAPPHLS